MEYRILKVILGLHGGAVYSEPAADRAYNGGAATNAESNSVRGDVKSRGNKLGLSDDLMQDYQNAVDSKKNKKLKRTFDEYENSTEDKAESFESLIKGKFKEEFNKRVNKAFKERFAVKDKQIEELKSNAKKDGEIISFFANKYPEVDPNDREALLKAIKSDNDLFVESALADGITAEEARNKFERNRAEQAEKAELMNLRKERALRDFDARLQNVAVKTKSIYPEFDLQKEMQNPDFVSALDFVAQSKRNQNRKTGKNDEIFDLTRAYEMTHWDDIKGNTIKRVGSAAISAAAQNIAANRKRPSENALSRGSAKQQLKSVEKMSESEFNSLLEKVKSGKARIPR